MTPNPNVILLKSVNGFVHYDEYRVAAGSPDITPGMLTMPNAAGEHTPHTKDGAGGLIFFAMENDFLGGTNLDTPYVAGDLLRGHKPQPGDNIYAWLKDGENVTPADVLTSAGDGTLRKAVAGDYAFARPLSSLNLAGGAVAAGRLEVEIIHGDVLQV